MKPEMRSSPAARAFFDALDSSKCDGETKQSDFVKKRIKTLGWRNRYSQDDFYPVQVGTTEFSVFQVQRGEIEGTYGTGATVWPASLVLIKYLERNAHCLLKGKRVVDLGAGTGVTSIAAVLLGATYCCCTDGEDSVVRLAKDNIDRQDINGLKEKMSTQFYWWGDGAIAELEQNPCDVVLVSDCVLPKLYPIAPLVEALDQLLVKEGATAILSYEHRYYPQYDPKDKFRELCWAKQLNVSVVPLSEQDPVYSVDDIEIWTVTR